MTSPGRSGGPREPAGGLGHQDLAAVGDRRDPRGPVDVEADHAASRPAPMRVDSPVCSPIRTRICDIVRPGLGAQRALPGDRRRDAPSSRCAKATKNESPSVPCSSPSSAAHASRRMRPVALEELGVALGAEPLLEPRRALDVGEQEGDGPARLPAAARSSLGSRSVVRSVSVGFGQVAQPASPARAGSRA